jgi:hypothetical protein
MKAPALSIVLVHGGFVDGSGWEGVYNILKNDGYNVTIVQNPTTSLADDVAFTKRVRRGRKEQGAARRTLVRRASSSPKAGTDPKVAGLVYVAAFAPDKGESVAKLIGNPPPGAPVPPILPPQDGFLKLDQTKFAASFAADVDEKKAKFMAASQVPWGVNALSGEVTSPAWKTKAELVSRCDRRQDDSAAGAAPDVETRGLDRRRSARQSCGLRVATAGRRRHHQAGGARCFELAVSRLRCRFLAPCGAGTSVA